jgi:hypothetical protein
MRQKNILVMCSAGTETKNDCAVEGQRQFTALLRSGITVDGPCTSSGLNYEHSKWNTVASQQSQGQYLKLHL